MILFIFNIAMLVLVLLLCIWKWYSASFAGAVDERIMMQNSLDPEDPKWIEKVHNLHNVAMERHVWRVFFFRERKSLYKAWFE
jgi:hypothetical protein